MSIPQRCINSTDALASHVPSIIAVIHALCNSHGRRQFVDVWAQFPDEVKFVINLYKEIWVHEALTKKQALNAAERLAYYHQQHFLPVMEKIREWGQNQVETEQIEGALLDNNLMEGQLKLIVRGRKNSNFHKTLAGSAISDITSIIATAVHAKINLFDYLNTIQRHQEQVKKQPQVWLPWNYRLNHDPLPCQQDRTAIG